MRSASREARSTGVLSHELLGISERHPLIVLGISLDELVNVSRLLVVPVLQRAYAQVLPAEKEASIRSTQESTISDPLGPMECVIRKASPTVREYQQMWGHPLARLHGGKRLQ